MCADPPAPPWLRLGLREAVHSPRGQARRRPHPLTPSPPATHSPPPRPPTPVGGLSQGAPLFRALGGGGAGGFFQPASPADFAEPPEPPLAVANSPSPPPPLPPGAFPCRSPARRSLASRPPPPERPPRAQRPLRRAVRPTPLHPIVPPSIPHSDRLGAVCRAISASRGLRDLPPPVAPTVVVSIWGGRALLPGHTLPLTPHEPTKACP